jgi:hypothetical protein
MIWLFAEKDLVKCYEELGCLETGDEWFDLLHRPLNLIPFDREKINTRFILYTRERVADVSTSPKIVVANYQSYICPSTIKL